MSVADILAQLAQNAGRPRQSTASLVTGTLADAAQVPGQIIADRDRRRIQALQEQRQAEQLQLQRNADARAGADQIAQDSARAQAIERQKVIDAGLAAGIGDSGDPNVFDPHAALEAVTQLGHREVFPDVLVEHRKLQQQPTQLDPHKDTYVGGVLTKPAVPTPRSMTAMDVAGLAMNPNPVVSAMARGQLALSRPPAPTRPGEIRDTAGGLVRVGDDNKVTPLGVQGYHPPSAAAAAAAGAGGLEPDAIDYTATQYRILGPQGIPTRLGEAEKIKILNAAAKQTKALGQSPAQAIQRQYAFKSDASALTRMTTMASAAEAFETKAIAQAELVRNLSAKVKRTDYPLVNDWIVSGKVATGDTDAHLFGNALLTFTTEYAKLMEGSAGSAAGSSDAARKDAARLISTGLKNGTIDKTLSQMQWEMQQTRRGYDVVIGNITDRMEGTGRGPRAGGDEGSRGITAPAGMVRVVGPNGETGSAPIGSVLPPGWKKQ